MLKTFTSKQIVGALAVIQLASHCLPVNAAYSANNNTLLSSSTAAGAANSGNSTDAPPALDLGASLPGAEWALPCEGKLDSQGKPRSATPVLTGTITEYDMDNDFGHLIDSLLDSALYGNTQMGSFDKSVAHYRQRSQQNLSNAKDVVNYMVQYRGFGTSSEAADIILDEKIKIKDKASAEYARQRCVDQTHPQVVAKTMQLALALGIKDEVRRDEMVGAALVSLSKLVGAAKAELTMQKLQGWTKDVPVPDSLYATASNWDVDFFHNKVESVNKIAMDGDPVMKEIVKRLHKYNRSNKVSQTSSHVVEGSLNLASLIMPGYVIPAAIQAVNLSYLAATGGSEEHKLIKELYYDKRVESRYRTINDEAQLALTQYQNALHQKNPTLLLCCESVLTQLVGPDNIADILGGRTLLAHHCQTQTGNTAVQTAQRPGASLQ